MNESYLSHHGILGQKWGIRRYQNPDGSLTEAGKKRYNADIERAEDKRYKEIRKKAGSGYNAVSRNVTKLKTDLYEKELRNTKEFKDYVKAQNDLENYEIHKWNGGYPNKEHDKFEGRYLDALSSYNKKINDVYNKHSAELLSARLKDLKLPDNDAYRSVLKEHQKMKMKDLNIDDDYYLQIFLD